MLKPGARFVILEFTTPKSFVVRTFYHFYFHKVLPFVGGVISGHRTAYQYLPKSVANFPAEPDLAGRMTDATEHTETQIFLADEKAGSLSPFTGDAAHRASLVHFALARAKATDPGRSYVQARIDATIVDVESGAVVWQFRGAALDRVVRLVQIDFVAPHGLPRLSSECLYV